MGTVHATKKAAQKHIKAKGLGGSSIHRRKVYGVSKQPEPCADCDNAPKKHTEPYNYPHYECTWCRDGRYNLEKWQARNERILDDRNRHSAGDTGDSNMGHVVDSVATPKTQSSQSLKRARECVDNDAFQAATLCILDWAENTEQVLHKILKEMRSNGKTTK